MVQPGQVYMVFGLFTFLGAFLSYIWPALWIASCVTTLVGIHVGVNSVSGGDLVHSQVIPIGIWCSTLSLRPVMFHIMVALAITFNYEACTAKSIFSVWASFMTQESRPLSREGYRYAHGGRLSNPGAL